MLWGHGVCAEKVGPSSTSVFSWLPWFVHQGWAPSQALSLSFFFFGLFAFSRATPMEYGDCQARGLIRAVASSLHHSYSNMGSEPRLRPTPQLMATPDT